MQDHNDDHPQGGAPGNLPIAQEAVRSQALALARSQALSLELKTGEADAGEAGFDLRGYWRILVKRRWTVLGALAIVLVTALVGTLLTTPIYRATASLQIDSDVVQVVDVGGVTPAEGGWSYEFYNTQYELLRSRALAQRVASDLAITDPARLAKLNAPSPTRKFLSLFSRSGGDDGGDRPDPKQLNRQVTGIIQGGLAVEPVLDSKLVRLHFDSADPKFSQTAVNAVADAYIASTLERRFESSTYAKSYLEERLQELKVKLEESERKLVEFADKEQIITVGAETANLSEQNMGSFNSALAKAKEERIRAEARWRQAQTSRGSVIFGDAAETSIIGSLQEKRSALLADYQDKLRLYKPAYPPMLQIKAQLDEIDNQINQEIGNIKAAIQAEYLGAVEQERMLSEQLTGMKGEVLDLRNRSIQYNIYKREVDTNRQLYDGLLQRYKEIGVAAGVTNNNISIIDRAEGAYKFKPSLSNNLTRALFVGLMLGILLALAFEYLDDTLKAPEDVEKNLGLSVLGVIPMLKSPMTPAKAIEDPRSAFSEAYRSVRTALQFSTDTGVPRSLLITSATPSEGKSTTALMLARNFAQLGKRVLVIDCDLRNPSLHRHFNADNSQGLSNYLAGAAKATEVIQPTEIPHLMFMPTGPLPPNPAELLMGPKMLSLLSIAAEKFDQIILDGPPVMGIADAPILGNMASGTLLVIESGETRIAVARNAVKRLVAARSRVIGGLMTKFEAKIVGYGGYGDYGYYAYGGTEAQKKLARK